MIAMRKEHNARTNRFLPNQNLLSTLFIILLFINGQNIFAQTDNFLNIGLGMEWNMNSRENFAGGSILGVDYNLPFYTPFAVGISVTGSSNFTGINVIELSASFRWYFFGLWHDKWFVQADAGTNFIFEDERVNPMFTGGLRGGYRLPLNLSFYIEPYGRFGFPYAWGVGVMAGYIIRGYS